MNQHLQNILDLIIQSPALTEDEKLAASKNIKDADKDLTITTFKLDRTEKVKQTTAILLQETIEELEQKRKAVEAQNRDLEIEAALERVRSRSMAMHESGDLHEVITVVTDQLSALGLKFDTANFAKVDSDGGWDLWISIPGRAYPEKVHVPYLDHGMFTRLNEAATKGFDFHADVYGYEEKNIFFNHVFENSILKNIPHERKQFVLDSNGFARSVFITKNILLSITRYDVRPFGDEDNAIFKRFANVFEQTYTRFLDLQKAEAQAREAEIELALERVRARTMAMQHSDELADASFVLDSQVRALGLKTWGCAFNIYGDHESTEWFSSEAGTMPAYKTPRENVFLRYYEAGQKGAAMHIEEFAGEACAAHYDYLCTVPVMGDALKKVKDSGGSFPTRQVDHVTYFKYGYLLFITFEPVPGAHEIFKRFSKVFEQTYTRFLDLQKAEAQAREALIETGLERVRSRSLAMHNTSELQDVIHTVHKELLHLNIAINGGSFIAINNDVASTLRCWGSGGTADTSEEVKLPLYDKPFCSNLINGIKNGPGFFTEEYTREEKRNFFTFLFNYEPWSMLDAEHKNETLSSPGGYTRSCCVSQHTSIFIINHFGEKFSIAENDILKRFAKVFEQTYTRFLDLQKAEEQAREAQIEAALERLRSRAMAMQNSDELSALIGTVFIELTRLDLQLTRCVIMIYDAESRSSRWWMANSEAPETPMSFFVKYHEHPPNLAYLKGWQERALKFEYILEGTVKKQWDDFIFSETELSLLPDFVIAGMRAPEKVYLNASFNNFGNLTLASLENLSGEQCDLLLRFAKVFDLTYTRFNDLKQAEAQAKEAMIAAALERIRTRTLLMKESSELSEATVILFEQFKALGLLPQDARTYFNVIHESDLTAEVWMTQLDGGIRPGSFRMPLDTSEALHNMYTAWKRGDVFHVRDLRGEKLTEYIDVLKGIPSLQADPAYQQLFSHPPERRVVSEAIYLQGTIGIISNNPISGDAMDILVRFAKVFEFTYTRFLDLKQAEAQAKEAQIEFALEKVRSRSMAMHKSDDLHEVIKVVTEQLSMVGLKFNVANFAKIDPDGSWTMWLSTPEQTYPALVYVPYLDHPIFNDVTEQIKKNNDFYTHVYTQEESTIFFHHFFENTIAKNTPEERKQFVYSSRGFTRSLFLTKNIWFSVSRYNTSAFTDEENAISKRFATVFEQTYTRFLDLQKAEAQAREAQIELGLERVRARAMAMQKSEELSGLVATLFEELTKLQLVLYRCIIWIFNPETLAARVWMANSEDKQNAASYLIKKLDHPYYEAILKGWKERTAKWVYDLSGEEKKSIDQLLLHETELAQLPEAVKAGILSSEHTVVSGSFNNFGLIEASGPVAETEEQLEILNRFGKVFDLTYTRFNDLKQAEAQAREAKIEAGLERLRARTMAMHSSEDVSVATATMFIELEKLGIENFRAGITHIRKNQTQEVWSINAAPGKKFVKAVGEFDMRIHPFWQLLFTGWKNKHEFMSFDMSGKVREDYLRIINARKDYLSKGLQHFPDCTVQGYFFGEGAVWAFSLKPHPEEIKQVLKRFAKVFSLTFRRYQDLQKAEAQAREAQIEAALERIRAKALAMQKSEDLADVANSLREQMGKLGQAELESSIVQLYEEHMGAFESWWAFNSSDGKVLTGVARVPIDSSEWAGEVVKNYRLKLPSFTIESRGAKLKEWYKVLEKYVGATIEYDQNGEIIVPEVLFYHFSRFSGGALYMIANQQPAEVTKELQRRAAVVFDLAYKRYKDLQQAEAQAREAQIEVALERVRSKAMAMHTSRDLANTIKAFYHQVETLTTSPRRLGIGIIDKDSRSVQLTTMNTTVQGNSIEILGTLLLTGHPVLEGIYTNWLSQTEYRPVLQADQIRDYYRIVRPQISYPDYPSTATQFGYFFFFPEGGVYAWTDQEMEEEDLKIYRRFTSVLSLTYRRYKELREAEAQTRQAQVETAMEKVRVRALAMQHLEEFSEVITVLRNEMGVLGMEALETSSIYVLDEATGNMICWNAKRKQENGEKCLLTGEVYLNLNETWIGRQMLAFYHGDETHASIAVPIVHQQEWQQYCNNSSTDLPGSEDKHNSGCVHHLNKFANGFVDVVVTGDLPIESWEIVQRATAVISFAYTRFSDLKQSAANAREATKRAALDRVRAEIASMRTVADLQKITPLVWNELTTLGVPFIRCGVFIMDESNEMIHTFLSTPEGKAIAAFHMPYQTPGNIGQVLLNWKQRQLYIDHWDEAAFTTFASTLVEQGALTSPEAYLKTIPHGGFYLHFFPFLQGMLYVGNTDALGSQEIQLVQSVAEAFSTAYARYEDFNNLESANKQIEKTLKELKQAQTQLIQSEKMASLGELTAGIAHEIQNPLNFVNNFSEVNTELLAELEQEVLNENYSEVHVIAKAIRENEQKINRHGKRADAIVKGMLEHSRSSGGIKIPTDLNKLVDEYLHLAYHGFRAKDKSFNATLNTNYDANLPPITIVPQDIGRVVLNLITNAFYAVTEKRTTATGSYDPTVSITTSSIDESVLIEIADNGPGISNKILDKIYQPFFTTKPTGQGTGLGLSLAYDIVKAHGGEMTVRSKEGDGAVFVISLPAVGKMVGTR